MDPIVWVPLSRLQSGWDMQPCPLRLEMIFPKIGGERRETAHTCRSWVPYRLGKPCSALGGWFLTHSLAQSTFLPQIPSTHLPAYHVQTPRVSTPRLTSPEPEDSTVAVCAACRADLHVCILTTISGKAEWAAQGPWDCRRQIR